MSWIQVGQLPFYGAHFPYFGVVDGAMVIAGGRQNSTPTFAVSAAVWRSTDGVDWYKIDNDLGSDHDQGSGRTVQGKIILKGLGATKSTRGKLTGQWDITATSSIKGTQVRWGGAGSCGDIATLNTIDLGADFGDRPKHSGFALNTTQRLFYKKDVTKGGGGWQEFTNGDPIPSGLLRNYGPIFTHGTTCILPNSFTGIPSPNWNFNGGVFALLGNGSPSNQAVYYTMNGFEWHNIVDWVSLPSEVRQRQHAAFCTGGGSMWLIGGYDGNRAISVWQSTNGYTWVKNPNDLPVINNNQGLIWARATFFNNAIYLVGGRQASGSNYLNTVYKLQL